MGFLHKRVLQQCHPGVIQLLPMTAPAWHNKQLESNLDKCVLRHGMYWRSLWGYVHIYNRLPQTFVDLDTVSKFQGALTHLARCRCNSGDRLWKDSFHSESEVWKTRLMMTWTRLIKGLSPILIQCQGAAGTGLFGDWGLGPGGP